MRTLVTVHLEPDFQRSCNFSLEALAKKVLRYSWSFDRVINITSSDSVGNGEKYEALESFEAHEWIWGFDHEYYTNEDPERWIEGKNWIKTGGHEASEILDWMHDLSKRDSYTLVGGCRSECLQDIYDIFSHLNLKVRVKETLTY